MIVEKVVNTKYGVLEQALVRLGFEPKRGLNKFGLPYVVFENNEYDTAIYLPDRPAEELVYGGHYLSALRTLEGFGIASGSDFDSLLQEIGTYQAKAA